MSLDAAVDIREETKRFGFAFRSALLPDLTTLDVAKELGAVLRLGDAENGLHELRPQSAAPANTYSGMFGLGEFPFHTDLAHWRNPPHYLILRCVLGYPEIKTLLVDSERVFTGSDRDLLARSLVTSRRPVKGRFHLMRLLRPMRSNSCLFRWDGNFLVPASQAGELGMSRVRDVIKNSRHASVALVRRGDTLVLDNWRMLHARSTVPRGAEDWPAPGLVDTYLS